jgi:membrane protease YdiL (CAAX protease family)
LSGRARGCAACGGELSSSAAFCPRCGAPTRAHQLERRRHHAERRKSGNRAVAAIALLFSGVLATVLFAALVAEESGSELGAELTWALGFVAVGLSAAALAGGRVSRESFAGRTDLRGVALGVGAGLLAIAFNAVWVALLQRLLSAEDAPAEDVARPLWLLLLTSAVLPALTEEWLCRGVLWRLCERAVPAAGTVLVTSALFGLLHAFQGWILVPHRVVTGVLLGWLRWKTGSLVPCVLAHFVNNALAVLVFAEGS